MIPEGNPLCTSQEEFAHLQARACSHNRQIILYDPAGLSKCPSCEIQMTATIFSKGLLTSMQMKHSIWVSNSNYMSLWDSPGILYERSPSLAISQFADCRKSAAPPFSLLPIVNCHREDIGPPRGLRDFKSISCSDTLSDAHRQIHAWLVDKYSKIFSTSGWGGGISIWPHQESNLGCRGHNATS